MELSSEDWVWIAEADDTSHPDFLDTLVRKIEEHTSLVYCQSRKIDEHGHEISPDNYAHTNDISPTKWMADYNESGVFEVVNSLAYRNSIPNTSSAIFRKSAAQGMAKQLTTFRYCGDWFFYAYLLARGDVGYSQNAYNNFRRHDGGVTRQQSRKPAYLIELARIREYIAETFPIIPAQVERMDWFLDRDYKIEGIQTTLPFGSFVCEHDAFCSGNFDTHFVKKYYSPEALKSKQEQEAKIAALIAVKQYIEDKKILRLPN